MVAELRYGTRVNVGPLHALPEVLCLGSGKTFGTLRLDLRRARNANIDDQHWIME